MIYNNNKCSKLDTENWETEPGGGWGLLWMELSERAAEKGMLSEDPTEQTESGMQRWMCEVSRKGAQQT